MSFPNLFSDLSLHKRFRNYKHTFTLKKAQANASTSAAGNSTDVSGERQNIGDGPGHIAYEIRINP
jgi:hypothetical protein